MSVRLYLKPGDVFEVSIGETKQFIQYLMNDTNLFNSNVIRAFEYEAQNREDVDLSNLVKKRIKFHVHTMIKGGIKLCGWKKVGNVSLEKGFLPPMFRATNDVYSEVKKSSNWFIWRAGDKESRKIGRLTDQYKMLDYGSVIHPIDIVEWLQTGTSGFMIPD